MRIVGLETEFALGFEPAPGSTAPPPTHQALFEAVAGALKQRLKARPALYYKGGDFLGDGSLLHFEVARLDAPHVGLLEWATPECLGAREAVAYSRAQEAALRDALPAAEAALEAQGRPGRVFLLKNNLDRRGNAYGCHESYDVRERPLRDVPGWLLAHLLHPLLLALLLAAALGCALPLLAIVLVPAILAGVAQALAQLPLVGAVFRAVASAFEALLAYLAEPGRGPGSGLLARASLVALRVGATLFDLTGPRVLFRGHQPALLPFLATRPALAGAGVLTADGRFELTPRARSLRLAVAAFIHGPRRPMIDVKELFYRKPHRWRAPRKRLHLLAGDANRAETSELLKLATTELVLDAIEAGALDALAASLELRDGPVGALRATAADPTLRAVVARERRTRAPLTALDVQRRYLEAVWEHVRSRPDATAEDRDTVRRWRAALERLEADPRGLDGELDWAIKLRLLSTALDEALPGRGDRAWADLAAWGPVNALLEAAAPDAPLPPGEVAGDVRDRVRRALGPVSAWRAARAVARAGLRWEDLPAVRAAWLRLKALDLRYHEVSREGGPFDRLLAEGRVVAALDSAATERARAGAPPPRTRAAVRGHWVASELPLVRAGWEKVLVGRGAAAAGEAGAGPQDELVGGPEWQTIDLSDPYRFEV